MTMPASPVREFDESSLEKIAYNSVRSIPTKEPNDRYRLGYHLWLHLKEQTGTIVEAVRLSGARILISEQEAAAIIESELQRARTE